MDVKNTLFLLLSILSVCRLPYCTCGIVKYWLELELE